MPHMQLHIQGPQFGWRVETKQGTEYLPDDVVPIPPETCPAATEEDFADYVEDEVESIEMIHGYFGRYSAPGYLDCTSWSFDTDAQTLRNELERMYGEDD